MESANRRLMWHGMFLFLLGLVTGFVEQRFANVRMGLAAHLEGVMNGTFLVALGAIWTEVRLPAPAKALAYWTALYGTYVNWLVTTLAAVFGTAALSPRLHGTWGSRTVSNFVPTFSTVVSKKSMTTRN
jgi:(hydroxyamino)benzene mutase